MAAKNQTPSSPENKNGPTPATQSSVHKETLVQFLSAVKPNCWVVAAMGSNTHCGIGFA
jgi:hypothetical protein